MKTNLYFIGNEKKSYMKIGVSSDPQKRLKSLQTGNPAKLVIHKVIRNISNKCETYIHYLFREKRLRGEWFCVNDALLDFMDTVFSEKQIYQYGKESGLSRSMFDVYEFFGDDGGYKQECRELNIPFIAILRNGRKYRVEYDFITSDYSLSIGARNLIEKLYQPMIKKYFKKHPQGQLTTSIGFVISSLDLDDLELCEDFMHEIYEIITDPINWQIDHQLRDVILNETRFELSTHICESCGKESLGKNLEVVPLSKNKGIKFMILCPECNEKRMNIRVDINNGG